MSLHPRGCGASQGGAPFRRCAGLVVHRREAHLSGVALDLVRTFPALRWTWYVAASASISLGVRYCGSPAVRVKVDRRQQGGGGGKRAAI